MIWFTFPFLSLLGLDQNNFSMGADWYIFVKKNVYVIYL